MTFRRDRVAALAVAALTAGLLAGCSDDEPDATPTGDGPSASATGTPSPSETAPVDRSREVVDGAAPLEEIGTTTGASGSSFRGATFTFYRLDASPTSTLLVWTMTGGGGSNPQDANYLSWELYPRMVVDDTEYRVLTYSRQGEDDTEVPGAVSNPVLRLTDGTESSPQSALFPPLPDDVDEVELKSPWFDNLTLPVSRPG
ncbi:hypothetical protein KC207_04985 [Phycicoccus sp. BSK3Z-2]|uniref:Uncharacterized protein n=1 Tax=Phycicoccus avicenniae TaxID=2828860 RepID=A0A941HZV1_9MICO|nr:hypothetical protein [Phycicoccus avicenniae]MBR7742641.1 hypothetical protein [Phycicoccus avicenniae]